MRILVIALIAAAAGTAGAAAQPASARWTIGGTAGAGGTWDDEGSLGLGVLGGGYTQWHVWENTAIEGAVEVLTHDRRGGAFEAHGHTTLVGASLLQQFGHGRIRGHVTGGILRAWHSGSFGFPAFGELRQRSSANRGYSFGGGATFRTRRVEMGPIARIVFMSAERDSDPWALAMGGFRIGFRR